MTHLATSTHHDTQADTLTPNDLSAERLLSRADAAAYLGISVSTCDRWCRAGLLRSVKVHTVRRIPLAALRELAGHTD